MAWVDRLQGAIAGTRHVSVPNHARPDDTVLAATLDAAGVPEPLPAGVTVLCTTNLALAADVRRAMNRLHSHLHRRIGEDEDPAFPLAVEVNTSGVLHALAAGRPVALIDPDTGNMATSLRGLVDKSPTYALVFDSLALLAALAARHGAEAVETAGAHALPALPLPKMDFVALGACLRDTAEQSVAALRLALDAVVERAEIQAVIDADKEGWDAAAAADEEEAATAAEASRKEAPPVVRRLSEMPGFPADLVDWGMSLAADLRAWHAGELAWDDVDRGVLLSGPPGCGKTTFVRALAAECDAFFEVTGYDQWHGGVSGDSVSKNLNKLFATWRTRAQGKPVLVLWDEVDSIGARGGNAQNESWFGPQINSWLAFLDGAQPRDGIVVLAATNAPDRVDPALVRPGRLDRHVAMPAPDREAMRAILAHHLRLEVTAPGMDEAMSFVSALTPAQAAQVARDARRVARRERRLPRPADAVRAAVGIRGSTPPDAEWRAAVHEAGHAVVALAVGYPVVHASLEPPHVRYEHGSVPTPTGVADRACVYLGAGAAEEAVFGCVSGGRESDLAEATALVARSVGWWGMGQCLHRLEGGETRVVLSPAREMEVEAVLRAQYGRALGIVRERRGHVIAVATRLVRRRYLTGAEVAEPAPRRDFGAWKRATDEAADRWYDDLPCAA